MVSFLITNTFLNCTGRLSLQSSLIVMASEIFGALIVSVLINTVSVTLVTLVDTFFFVAQLAKSNMRIRYFTTPIN